MSLRKVKEFDFGETNLNLPTCHLCGCEFSSFWTINEPRSKSTDYRVAINIDDFCQEKCSSYVSDRGEQTQRSSYEKFEDDEETTTKPMQDFFISNRNRYIDQRKGNPVAKASMSVSGSVVTTKSPSDMSPLIFPDYNNSTITAKSGNINPTKKSKVPLKLLRKLAHESDVFQVFEKYVSNVQLKSVQGQKYVFNSEGQPIEAGIGGPVQGEESTTEKSVVKPFTGFSIFNDRNMLNKPQAMANEERIASTQAGSKLTKAALCEPELKTVEVPKPSDPNVIQFPRCVRIERCGGCCGSDLLSCEPVRSKPTEVQVQKFSYNDKLEKLEYTGTETVILPSHVECRCNCRVKAGDCSPKHAYISEDCLCTCKNPGDQEACHSQTHKLWDPNLCQCICREIKACTSGFSFNLETCECTPTPNAKLPAKGGTERRRRSRNSQRGL